MADHLEEAYAELHQLAQAYLQRERANHTLQPTAVLHEAWMRLADRTEGAWNDKTHFLATCARAMRQVLVDHARAKATDKRGGQRMRMSLSLAAQDAGPEEELDVIELDDALEALRKHSERQASVVEMRFFAGLTVDEVAQALGISPRTVASDWRFAQAWLTRELRGAD